MAFVSGFSSTQPNDASRLVRVFVVVVANGVQIGSSA